LHELTVHAPPVQAGVPFAAAHALPQLPQLVAVVVLVSQPLVAIPSQLPQPAPQVGTQALPVQAVVPCALVQVVPQAPQLDALLLMSVSQPVVALPSQSRQVPVQTGTHALAEQLVVP
jgi:hypothetical protein